MFLYGLKKEEQDITNILMKLCLMLFDNEIDNVSEKEKEKEIIEKEFTLPYIYNYIIDVLVNFTNFRKDGTLNLRVYLNEVFIKIVDIYGFVISYLPIFAALYENYTTLNKLELELFERLKSIFIKYLFSPRITPINIRELTKELKELNQILIIPNTNSSSKKSASLKVSSSTKNKGVTGQTYLVNFSHNKTSKKTRTYNI